MGRPFHFKASDTCRFSATEIPLGTQQIPRHWVSEITAFAELWVNIAPLIYACKFKQLCIELNWKFLLRKICCVTDIKIIIQKKGLTEAGAAVRMQYI
jgi:hypothetical protein